jgi:hypothetical protein
MGTLESAQEAILERLSLLITRTRRHRDVTTKLVNHFQFLGSLIIVARAEPFKKSFTSFLPPDPFYTWDRMGILLNLPPPSQDVVYAWISQRDSGSRT